jgi:hypothetical protein
MYRKNLAEVVSTREAYHLKTETEPMYEMLWFSKTIR